MVLSSLKEVQSDWFAFLPSPAQSFIGKKTVAPYTRLLWPSGMVGAKNARSDGRHAFGGLISAQSKLPECHTSKFKTHSRFRISGLSHATGINLFPRST